MSKIRLFLMVMFALIAIGSGTYFVRDYLSKQKEEDVYEKLRQSVTVTETTADHTGAIWETQTEETPEAEYDPDDEIVKAVMDQYEDVVGWVRIKDTNISYPILQDVDDNEYYLHHNIDGDETASGAIYLDSNHDINADGLHVVYGHHMRNGSMFRDVVEFCDADYMASHQDITVWTRDKKMHLEPVYCYAGVADGTYRSVIEDPGSLEQFLKEKTGRVISGDNIFVLITCSYGSDDERTYLICREKIK